MNCRSTLLASFLVFASHSCPGQSGKIEFAPQELPTRLEIGYAVRILDMNGDGRQDIAIVDKRRIIWLESPTWIEHTLIADFADTDNVCFAPYDIDGDGDLDFAVGADWTVNTQQGGTIHWLEQAGPNQPWKLHPIGEEPTVHRMRFADLDADGRSELIVLPLMGRNSTRPDFAETGVRILAFAMPSDPVAGPWIPRVLNDELHVTHNFFPVPFDADPDLELLVASFEGVSLLDRQNDRESWRRTLLGTGNQETSPNRGASEVKLGQLADGSNYIATIEPWHGHQVVVYRPGSGASGLWTRHVLDEELKWGHAVWCDNLDQDPEQELIIGVRDDHSAEFARGLRIYDPQADGSWVRTIIDPGSVAIEDLAAADLDGDGRIDIVAVGRQTHNVRIYWNRCR